MNCRLITRPRRHFATTLYVALHCSTSTSATLLLQPALFSPYDFLIYAHTRQHPLLTPRAPTCLYLFLLFFQSFLNQSDHVQCRIVCAHRHTWPHPTCLDMSSRYISVLPLQLPGFQLVAVAFASLGNGAARERIQHVTCLCMAAGEWVVAFGNASGACVVRLDSGACHAYVRCMLHCCMHPHPRASRTLHRPSHHHHYQPNILFAAPALVCSCLSGLTAPPPLSAPMLTDRVSASCLA